MFVPLISVIIVPLLLTIIIEGLVAGVILRDWRDMVVVALTQCITNPMLNLILVLCRGFGISDLIVVIVLLEIVVIIIEFLIYRRNFRVENKGKSLVVAVLANVVAVVGGGVLLGV